MEDKKEKLHVAMFPWLAHGHLMPFLEVSRFLAQKGHRVSFISTPKNIHRLQKHSPISSSSPLINLVEIPLPHVDGLPESTESTAEIPIHKVPYLKKAYDKLQFPLAQLLKNSDINWIIQDFASNWLPRLAAQFGINSIFFSIYNATTLAFLGPPSELLGGHRQRPEDYTVVPDWIDFPSNVAFKLHEVVCHWVCMDSEASDFERIGEVVRDCRFVIARSCTEYEANSLSLLRNLYKKPVVPVGLLPPLVPSIKDKDDDHDQGWETINEWLGNINKDKSVVYIALGTEVNLSRDLMHELAYGIEKSGLPFIWVVNNRKLIEDLMGPDILPSGFETRVSGRGLIWRGWAPQLRILAHSSVGGFLTHCGWSSVIEALGFGRALILFPSANSDQGLIARQLHERRVGLEIPLVEEDGSFTSDSLANTMKKVMVEIEGEPLRANAWAMRDVFGNADLQATYLSEFTHFLENFSTIGTL